MAKAPILKVADKLTKVNDNLTVFFYDNAYLVEIGGRDATDEWGTVKLVCNTLEDVLILLKEVDDMPRD
jgi:hypothetical protein